MHTMLRLITAVLFLQTIIFPAAHAASRDTDPKLLLLKHQVLKDILATAVHEKEVMDVAATIKEDGSWADIDYTDKTRGGWPVADHLSRLNSMAVVYKNPGRLKDDPALLKKITSGLNYWLQHDFICPNWWYPQIGVPKILAPIMLMMEDKLTPAQMETGIKILERAKIGMTGQNKVWLSGNVIYRSLLNNDTAAVTLAVKTIQDEIIVSEGEGIQPDYSFHQHGTQQQFGNYGSAYAADMLKWAGIFQGTPYQFDAAKITILRNYLLQGMKWIIWKNKMDISACGRQLFPAAQVDKAKSIAQIMKKMPLVDAAYKDQYATTLKDFEGDNHFWKSDMTVHRRNNFYASVKMSSKRVGGAESCNEENIQGYHLGDGATYFYQSNEEYTDIFPFWDWKMIPGVTAFHDDIPLPVLPCSGYNIPTDFTGGVSDGANGIAAINYQRDSLYAHKAWFFFDDAIICLGAGIHSSENKEIRTTINQSFLHGNVVVKQAVAANTIPLGTHHLDNVKWVLHDNWGYYFPAAATLDLSNQSQPGSWHNVLKRMPDQQMKADMFTLWFNHHVQPKAGSYAYYVFAGATAANIETRAEAWAITENSAAIQAVENPLAKRAGLVFQQPGEVSTKTFGKISADQPCILMLTQVYATQHLSLSDPTHQLSSITIGIRGNKKASGIRSVYEKSKDMSLLKILLPTGAEAGKTISLILE